jgi:very-short-patch-repair endonuclease
MDKINYKEMSEQEKKQLLKKMYVDEKKSTYEIQKEIGIDRETVRKHLMKFGIPLRTRQTAIQNAGQKGKLSSRLGDHHSLEDRLKIATSVRRNWENMSDEEYEQLRKARKEAWDKRSTKEKEEFKRKGLQKINETAKTGSKLEHFLLRELIANGYKVEFHKERWVTQERLQIDIFLPEIGVAIEVDGPSHYTPIFYETPNQIKFHDYKKNSLLIAAGYRVIRIRNKTTPPAMYERYYILNELLKTLDNISSYPQKQIIYIEYQGQEQGK